MVDNFPPITLIFSKYYLGASRQNKAKIGKKNDAYLYRLQYIKPVSLRLKCFFLALVLKNMIEDSPV